jgi:large subunit ribosomal protein L15
MKLHTLSPAIGSTKKSKRIGRGPGSGHGKTATKGHKGANARTGGGVSPFFEGGQMPLVRRLPKFGFVNIFREEYSVINVERLNEFENGTVVDVNLLKEKGIIKNSAKRVKVLGNGDLKKNLIVRVNKFSHSAKKKIESLGGKAEVI